MFKKKNLVKLFIIILLLIMFACPALTLIGARAGLMLWFETVLPTLLPFIILSGLIVGMRLDRVLNKLFYPLFGRLLHISKDACYPVLIGFLSGLPLGAKTVADLVRAHRLSRSEAEFLLPLSNNASPAFILGYIATATLQKPSAGPFLLLIVYSSAIICALLLRFIKRNKKPNAALCSPNQHLTQTKIPASSEPESFLVQLDGSIMDGFYILTKVGGYIILFSILSALLSRIVFLLSPMLGTYAVTPSFQLTVPLLSGFLEMTTGIHSIAGTELAEGTKIALCAAIASFGGLSGLLQTKGVTIGTELSIKNYFYAKILQGFLAFVLCMIAVLLRINTF